MADKAHAAVVDLAAVRRDRGSRYDGRCMCGHYRALCSPMGRTCFYADHLSQLEADRG